MLRDLRWSVRAWHRHRTGLLGIVAVLALGLGANGAIADAVYQLLLRPPAAVREPKQLVRLSTREVLPDLESLESESMSFPLAHLLTSDESVLSSGGAGGGGAAYMLRLTAVADGKVSRRLRVAFVSDEYFAALGVHPILGTTPHDGFQTPQVHGAVLSYSLWQSGYGASTFALGRTLRINSVLYPIVGITPRGFSGIDLATTDVWVPLDAEAQSLGPNWRTNTTAAFLTVFARVRPGTSLQAVEDRLSQLFGAYLKQSGRQVVDSHIFVDSNLRLRGAERHRLAQVAVILSAISLLLLFAASANAINLLIARWVNREREVAIRLAVGASPVDVFRLLIADVIVVGVLSTSAGLVTAAFASRTMHLWLLPSLDWSSSRFFLLISLAAYTCAALVFGGLTIVPWWVKARRFSVVTALGNTHAGASTHSTPWRFLSVAIQGAVVITLLTGAGLFITAFRRLIGSQLGFEAQKVLIVDFAGSRRAAGPVSIDRLRDLQTGVSRIPGVTRVALASDVPLRRSAAVEARVDGIGRIAATRTGGPYVVGIDDQFIATVGATVVQGRSFNSGDLKGAERVAIINESLMRRMWRGGSPIGGCILLLDERECRVVIGVVKDLRRESVLEATTLQIFLPYTQAGRFISLDALFVRAAGDATDVRSGVTRVVLRYGYALSDIAIDPLSDLMQVEVTAWHMASVISTAYGFLALLIASLGLLSTLNFVIAERRLELAIRAALGARPHDLWYAVGGKVIVHLAFGVVIGAALLLAAWKTMVPLLFGVTLQHVLLSGSVAALFLLISLAVCLIVLSPHRTSLEGLRRQLLHPQ